jgi:predicted acyltransferase
MSENIQQRLVSLDVFRGMTIAGMVLVNNPGTWSSIYGPLKHAEWHGITPTDYIFPFFLFIVGVAIPIALGKRVKAGVTKDTYLKILGRAATIFLVGILMSAIPFFNFSETTIPYAVKVLIVLGYAAALFLYLWDKRKIAFVVAGTIIGLTLVFWLAGYLVVPYNVAGMRIPGVLQRIAVCYLIVSIIFLHTNWKQQSIIGVVLLLVYWLLMTATPVPGCEVTTIDDKACNLAAYLDRTILTEAHIWRSARVFDPEGILSTIPALVTTLTGVLAGTWLLSVPPAVASGLTLPGSAFDNEETARSLQPPATARGTDSHLNKVGGLFFAGAVALAVGWFWSLVFPLNKSLWTSSYVVYTSGLALLTLASCYWLIDIKGYRRWAKPFVIFGVNALALFVFSGIMARILGMIRFAGPEGNDISLQQYIFNEFFLHWASPVNASLAYATCFILFWLFLMWLLYRKKIYIKV